MVIAYKISSPVMVFRFSCIHRSLALKDYVKNNDLADCSIRILAGNETDEF